MYKDRGIMKWAPFDALSGFTEAIAQLKYNRNKIDKPILSSDMLDELTIKINEAIFSEKAIEIKYYEDGYFKISSGIIKEVNMIEQKIVLKTNFKIPMQNVTNIQMQ